ncbi:helix-turn-helix domain-containing protein [Hymenobacter lucidus]|uniref:Helix-turn-helix domain-containing protein n=1 Tax=Hymenobacter lucidus TaxID=2880930 RepID=A0ABS8APT3_9BACT|nr:helix-turn-helix domain-containing protein [Hymenobacter lucidus]MCB2407012.1 helix-turn-helix domain-containing protein [Hymenobacter lucidus]
MRDELKKNGRFQNIKEMAEIDFSPLYHSYQSLLTPFGERQLMPTTLITASVGYAQLLDEFRAMIRQELSHLQALSTAPTAAVGGIELAMEITRLSRSRIYALVQERGIPHGKRGNKLYFDRAKLLAWVEEGERQEKQVR